MSDYHFNETFENLDTKDYRVEESQDAGNIYSNTLSGCQDGIEEYFKRYHFAGYGTRLLYKKAMPDGTYQARLVRSKSCD